MPGYRELAPSAHLRAWVDSFWTRPAFVSRDAVVNRILPDGCADVIFTIDDAQSMVVGTMTKPLLIESTCGPEMLGIRFRPGRALPLLGMPLAEVTDARVPLQELWRGDAERIAETLANARTLAERVAMLEREIERRIAGAEVDRRVDAAIARMLRTPQNVEIIARDIGISRQHLRRQFLEHVGVTPKTFARVARFRRVIVAARDDRASWAAIAIDHGYADQSHLIADFQEFAGVTPVPFFLSPLAP